MNPDSPPSSGTHVSSDQIKEWISGVRARVPAPLPPPTPARRRVPWWVVAALLVPATALSLYWGRALLPTPPADPEAVTGKVCDARAQPIANALVFAVTMPDQLVRTDRQGRFTLPAVPVGAQLLVVVVEEIGQEFPVQVAVGKPLEAGALAYVVTAEDGPEQDPREPHR